MFFAQAESFNGCVKKRLRATRRESAQTQRRQAFDFDLQHKNEAAAASTVSFLANEEEQINSQNQRRPSIDMFIRCRRAGKCPSGDDLSDGDDQEQRVLVGLFK